MTGQACVGIVQSKSHPSTMLSRYDPVDCMMSPILNRFEGVSKDKEPSCDRTVVKAGQQSVEMEFCHDRHLVRGRRVEEA